jgi:hypothetical protein
VKTAFSIPRSQNRATSFYVAYSRRAPPKPAIADTPLPDRPAARAIIVPMSRERTIRGWSKAGMSMGERARANHITIIEDVARFRDADGRPHMAGTVGGAGHRTMFVRAVEDRMGVMRYGSPGKGDGDGRTVIILATSGEPSHDREFDRRDDMDGVLRLAHRMREAHLADAIRVVDSLPIA